MKEISNRPYMIRAMFDWIVDNEWTPHLQIDANYPNIQVPQEFAQDGIIVLNVHPDAVQSRDFANDWFAFNARFQGIERAIGFPPEAILAIFARENGQGMPFPPEPYPETLDTRTPIDKQPQNATLQAMDGGQSDEPERGTSSSKKRKKGHLTVVK